MPVRQGPIAASINNYLRSKGSPLAGLGGDFVRYGQQYGIDPRLIVAISGAETSLGTYGPSQRIHNPFGMGPGINYPTYGSAIGAVAANLAKNYFGQGLDTIPEIQGKWAPSGAGNDPTNLNSNWTKNVTQYYKELGGNPADLGTTGEVATYVKTAADMESQYADVANPPNLTSQKAPGLTPQQKEMVDRHASTLSDLIMGMNGEEPLGLTTRQRAGTSRVQPVEGGGSGMDMLSSLVQSKLKDRMSAQLQDTGVGVHWDDGTVATPNAATFMGSAADYMKQHPFSNRLIHQAKSFLGDPYKWGGSSPKTGFDCSGFAQWLYAQQGIKLPRVTYDQIKSGSAVGIKNLQPGDLVFFGTKKDPHHEGIYIGNGQFIHAPHTGDVVKISSLTGYYRDNFVTGRRVAR